jgi:hypothetical protein
MRCALHRVESSVAVLHRSLDFTRTPPAFDTFGSLAWYPCSCDTKPTDNTLFVITIKVEGVSVEKLVEEHFLNVHLVFCP